MTNSTMFKTKIKEAQLTLAEVANSIGITRQGLHRKINNQVEFKASEISKCTQILSLSREEREKIFFS